VAADPPTAFRLTSRFNTVAVVTDGSAVPGLGDIGPLATLPLVEAKCRLLSEQAGISAWPVAIDSAGVEDAARVVAALTPSLGAVNLEAVGEAGAMIIKRRVADLGELPVYQDNLDGLPVICLAALLNALKVAGKRMADVRLVVSGAEADGLALVDFLRLAGAADVVVCDRLGAVHKGRPGPTNWVKEQLASKTNPRQLKGALAKVAAGADALILLPAHQGATRDLPAAMEAPAVILDLSGGAAEGLDGAAVYASLDPGRPNCLAPALLFPGLLRGVLDARARQLNAPMKMAAAMTLSRLVPEDALGPGAIVPPLSKPNLVQALAEAVSAAAAASGAGRLL
jgi:malate dehydrogenase (oxaloacetate-decarboxylating)